MSTLHNVTLIPGDGTGPEISATVQKVVEATGVRIQWDVVEAGAGVVEKYGTPLPENVLASIRKNKIAIKGPLTTPIGAGFRSVNVALRKELDLYACLRPCKTYAGVRSRYTNVNLVVVRENTEDLYVGVEYEANSEKAKEIISWSPGKIFPDAAISIKPISRTGTERIVKFAFDYAVAHGRRKVTAICKANIMKFTDGLFYDVAREVAKKYEGKVAYEEVLVDAMCMQLVQRPEKFDVLVLPNLYGDILSDLCAGLIGGLGIAPGANFGKDTVLFEPVHGSAPKHAGKNKVNPTAMLLSAVLMLDHMGEKAAAQKLENAISRVIREGKSVTYDMKERSDDPTAVGTSQMGDAIIAAMKSEVGVGA